MELDDLRRQWQQSGQVPQPPAGITPLLRRKSTNLVEKLRRNVVLEASLCGLLVVAMLLIPARSGIGKLLPFLNALRVLLSLLLLVLMYYYYRKLQLLKRMIQPETQVRKHLALLCVGLRQMLRFYYRFSIFTLPLIVLLLIAFQVGRELVQKAPHHWDRIGIFAGLMLVLGGIMQVVLIYITRWWLQLLYGQHLDRLEGQLRELDEPGEN